jgi:hypothetical protein
MASLQLLEGRSLLKRKSDHMLSKREREGMGQEIEEKERLQVGEN